MGRQGSKGTEPAPRRDAVEGDVRHVVCRAMALALALTVVGLDVAAGDPDRAWSKATAIAARGDRARAVGNTRKAAEQYRKALRALPELPEGHLGLGHVFMQRRRFEEAYAAFLEAERCYANEGADRVRLRRQRHDRARLTAAKLRVRSHILKHNIDKLEALVSTATGRTAVRQKTLLHSLEGEVRQLDEEVERLERIAAPAIAEPGEVPGKVYFFLGNALLNLDRTAEAIVAWEACASKTPSFPIVYNNLAVGYWKLGQLDRAMANLALAEQQGFVVNPEFKTTLEREVAGR